jgi:hypothetical protein
MLVWNVKRYDCNADIIRDYNVLKYAEDFIKKQKKKCADKEEFAEALKRELMYRFWSKAEHELIIEVVIDRVILSPWCGCREPALVAIDVTSDTSFDWRLFAEYHIGRQCYSSKAKIDVWDQLAIRFDELVDYCWYTRLPYERKNKKFERFYSREDICDE